MTELPCLAPVVRMEFPLHAADVHLLVRGIKIPSCFRHGQKIEKKFCIIQKEHYYEGYV